MELVRYCSGERHTILLMDCGSKHDVKPLLDELDETGNSDFHTITALLDRTAKAGVVWNELKAKRLTGEINEFKARRGTRILWFFDEKNRALIVCTHAFVKKQQKTPPGEIARAEERLKLYRELSLT